MFFEASIAWEKRQSERRAQQQKARWAWAPFTPASGANMQEAARQAADASADDDAPRVGKRVNAAAMANAARRWRDFQRKKRQRDQKLLSDAVSN